MLDGLANLSLRGVPVDWSAYDRDYPRRKVSLPTYPFERQRYWLAEDGLHGSSAVAPAAAMWRDWLYDLTWQAAPLAAANPQEASVSRTWLICSVAKDVGHALGQRLEARGDVCLQNPWTDHGFTNLPLPIGQPLHGIVLLTDAGENATDWTIEELLYSQMRLFSGVLDLIRSLVHLKTPPRLWLVTLSECSGCRLVGALGCRTGRIMGSRPRSGSGTPCPPLRLCGCRPDGRRRSTRGIASFPDDADQTAWRRRTSVRSAVGCVVPPSVRRAPHGNARPMRPI